MLPKEPSSPSVRDQYFANYEVTPDGHFIMLGRGATGGKLRVAVNWTEELKQILVRGGVR